MEPLLLLQIFLFFSWKLNARTLQSAKIKLQLPTQQQVADNLLTNIFKVKPLFKLISNQARQRMINQANKIDVDWMGNVKNYQQNFNVLNDIFHNLKRESIEYPEYYLQPFHAYDDGNLSWEAAMEVTSAALAVHSHIFSDKLSNLSFDKNGDYHLRQNYHNNIVNHFKLTNFKPKTIIDIGCSTGLSTLKLHESFPEAEIIGVDLSPYMVSVAKYELSTQEVASKSITYIHGSGEEVSKLYSNIDLISMSLICHELPSHAARNIFSSIYGALRSGGVFSIMDMDPMSPRLKKLASNPFAFAGFKSTEPWIQEYLSLDILEELKSVGFLDVFITQNSPQHRTIICRK